MKKIIIFLIRRWLKLRKGDFFIFENQKTNNVYFFTSDSLMKMERGKIIPANVGLNWLLDPKCEILNCKSHLVVATMQANKKYYDAMLERGHMK